MLLALGEKSRTRRENALFIVEGRLEIKHCIEAGYNVKALFACPDIISGRELDDIAGLCGEHCTLYEVSRLVYEKIAYRSGTEGIIAEVEIIEKTLKDVRLRENPLVVVLESVEKPGNLGAVLRTADAADADAVVVCDPGCFGWVSKIALRICTTRISYAPVSVPSLPDRWCAPHRAKPSNG